MPGLISIDLGNDARTSALIYHAEEARVGATLVLAHGAGAPQQSAFMMAFARGLAARGVDVVTFNFLYTEQKRRIPDRAEKLEACYRAVIEAARGEASLSGNRMFIGGKSMGGRIATHLAAEAGGDLSGVILLGYPLHPPGKPE